MDPVDPLPLHPTSAAAVAAVLLPESYVSQLLREELTRHLPVSTPSLAAFLPSGVSSSTLDRNPVLAAVRYASTTPTTVLADADSPRIPPAAAAEEAVTAVRVSRSTRAVIDCDVTSDVVPKRVIPKSQIYCEGDLLKVIQLQHLYPDSKTFVDMRLKFTVNETLNAFENLMKKSSSQPSRDEVKQFVSDYFLAGSELEVAEIPDWVDKPRLYNKIADPKLREWFLDLNNIWKNLSRKVSDDVLKNSEHYSLIYVPNRFIIPGGRFRELYYWDTYWIVRGLLLSDMHDTVKGILGNFMYLLENYGIIPNGARVYYLERSQPPLLSKMVDLYYEATKDVDFLRANIHLLELEFDFWMKNRTVAVVKDGKTYTLLRYYAVSEGPRPESYREDYENSQVFATDERKLEFYIDMKSAAESGWDFSSRWFIKDGANKGNLTDIHTRHIIPVDINAFVYGCGRLLSKFHSVLGNGERAKEYAHIANHIKEAVTAVLWNEEEGSWFDYDMLNKKPRKYFYPSNIAPLWTKCYDQKKTHTITEKVVNYLEGTEILKDYLGGIPTSLNNTGEQWDLPNAWPPLQSLIIQGLDETRNPRAQHMAYKFAENWVHSNYKGYVENGEMHEKYDAENPGSTGGGGEYDPQTGFGWTNGLIMDLLDRYGEKLQAENFRAPRRSLMDILHPEHSQN